MSQEHPSKLSFSIEESVWLNKGQEVEEIVGMSLEPEIVIEEKDLHVYIRGGLRLLGEYRSAKVDDSVDVGHSLEQQVSFRSAGDVTVSPNGIGEIKHFFPIDVTIPSSRIQNLDDVYVQVESFDYDLPEKSCIQLTADIGISGMTYQQEEEVKPRVDLEEAVPTAFTYEAKREAESETTSPINPNNEPVNEAEGEPIPKDTTPSFAPSPVSRFERKEQPKEELYTPSAALAEEPAEESPSASLAPEVEEVKEVEELEELEPVNYEEDLEELDEIDEIEEQEPFAAVRQTETKINLAPLKELATVSNEQTEETKAGNESEPVTPREENALYLTKMLSKGEERFSKWRMCIIQENETLDIIAERYEISTSQLMRTNRLQGEQVEEGQILYIPVSVESL
ncbi:stage VI sporulation protein D [Bacillus suaedae]|uniref:Stage VI sporulation protein D n=1 Tax=Halalkalibacter suaedae TaxID=2822140 RepID=A0A940WNE4_9BACI|nr:stage VI sporulation protein D [Bacillus suaedae]